MGYKTFHEMLDEDQAEHLGVDFVPVKHVDLAATKAKTEITVSNEQLIHDEGGFAVGSVSSLNPIDELKRALDRFHSRTGKTITVAVEGSPQESIALAKTGPCPLPDETGIMFLDGRWGLEISDTVAKYIKSKRRQLTERECFMVEAAMQHGFEMIGDDGNTYIVTDEQIISLMQSYRSPDQQTFDRFKVNEFIDDSIKMVESVSGANDFWISSKDAGEIAREACLRIIMDKATLITNLANDVHWSNVRAGWWNDLKTGEDLHGKRNVGELLALVHSEISEAAVSVENAEVVLRALIERIQECLAGQESMTARLTKLHTRISNALEGYRKSLMDDKLTHRPQFRVELLDAMIRILDILGSDQNRDHEHPAGVIFCEKRNYNDVRPDHQRENRLKADGKQF